MKTKVGTSGLLISRELLGGADEVEIRKENGAIVITPVALEDPIWRLGSHPIMCEVTDASTNTDRYLYGP